jgi:hypothetical protein
VVDGCADRLRPHKTLYNRFIRWSRLGVFDRIFAGSAGEGLKPERTMIDAAHLSGHHTAAGLRKSMFPTVPSKPIDCPVQVRAYSLIAFQNFRLVRRE